MGTNRKFQRQTALRVAKEQEKARWERQKQEYAEIAEVLKGLPETIIDFYPQLANGYLAERVLLADGMTREQLDGLISYGGFYPYIYKDGDERRPMAIGKGDKIGIKHGGKRLVKGAEDGNA